MNQFKKLCEHLTEINDLQSVSSLLSWDQATFMPSGGSAARGRQQATLRKLSHEKFASKETETLLNAAENECSSLSAESFERSLIKVTRRDFEKSVRVPAEFWAEFSTHTSSTYDAWLKARAEKNFKIILPYLEKTLALSQKYSTYFSEAKHVADPHIANADEGMSVADVRPLFEKLRAELVPLVKKIGERPAPDESKIQQSFDSKLQLALGEKAIRAIGYDFERGRNDLTTHPFMTKFSLNDVRITTRVQERDMTDCFFSMMHEAGHALYEQNIDARFEATPLARGISAGVHESQSRLWENLVGRSLNFWEYFYPELQKTFPEPFAHVSLQDFYAIINKVEPSLIRTDADEVTYNLHVMIRFDLELAMLEGRLAIKDLPEAWNARYQSDLGVTPPDDVLGCMQDVHWHCDFIGGLFQGYTIGNILSAQFFESACKAHPQIPNQISKGDFATLRGWLIENIYKHGAVFDPSELVRRATGKALTIEPYVNYLKKKYGQLYGIDLK